MGGRWRSFAATSLAEGLLMGARSLVSMCVGLSGFYRKMAPLETDRVAYLTHPSDVRGGHEQPRQRRPANDSRRGLDERHRGHAFGVFLVPQPAQPVPA